MAIIPKIDIVKKLVNTRLWLKQSVVRQAIACRANG